MCVCVCVRVHFLLVCGPFSKLCGRDVCVLKHPRFVHLHEYLGTQPKGLSAPDSVLKSLLKCTLIKRLEGESEFFLTFIPVITDVCGLWLWCSPRKVAGNASAYIWHSSPWEFLINICIYVGFMRPPPFPFLLFHFPCGSSLITESVAAYVEHPARNGFPARLHKLAVHAEAELASPHFTLWTWRLLFAFGFSFFLFFFSVWPPLDNESLLVVLLVMCFELGGSNTCDRAEDLLLEQT